MTDNNTKALEDLHAATVAALVELATALRDAHESGDGDATEAAERAISEAPLSVQVRDGWRAPGCESGGAEEFEILLSTGGPATRIRGDLDRWGEPDTFFVEVQDWGTRWRSFIGMTGAQGDLIRRWYLSAFYMGDA